jgi:hypothetical protein
VTLSRKDRTREPWPHESCFDCQLRMPDDRAADVHYAMTGHQMGWPLDVDEMGWPLAAEAQIMGHARWVPEGCG